MPFCNEKTIIVVTLCVLWHGVSTSSKLLEKEILNLFGYPMSLTLVQLFWTAVLTWPLLKSGAIDTSGSGSLERRHWLVYIFPLAVGKIVTTVCTHFAVLMGPLSFAHTVRASSPLFTAVFARVLFQEEQTLLVYLSLPPIIFGIGIATITEVSFTWIGLFTALAASCGLVLQNIYNKRLLKLTKIHTFELVLMLNQLSFLIFAPVWIGMDLISILKDVTELEAKDTTTNWPLVSALLTLDGVLNFLINLLAFKILSLVHPLTYAVINVSKRIEIIALSILIFKNKVTILNLLGMALALGGVLFYTYAKHRSNKAKKKSYEGAEAFETTNYDYGSNLNLPPPYEAYRDNPYGDPQKRSQIH